MDKDSSPAIKVSFQPHPGEGGGEGRLRPVPCFTSFKEWHFLEENESILLINQFVSIKVKMKLKQFFVSSRNLKRDMLPNG